MGERATRSDARANVQRILSAAIDALGSDPEATMQDIAEQAGVGRVTVYAHYPSRGVLVRAALEEALSRGEVVLAALEPADDPEDALERLVESSWTLSAESANLWIAARQHMSDGEIREIHDSLFGRALDVLRRGQAAGRFRDDLPDAWLVDALHALMKLALDGVTSERLSAESAPRVVLSSALGLWRATPGGDATSR